MGSSVANFSFKAVLNCSLLILIFLFPGSIESISANSRDQKKSVLVLHSYHKDLSWTNSITKGIEKRFQEEKMEITCVYEYMDTKRFFSETHYSNLEKVLKYKYFERKFDVIITSDDNAFRFLLKRGENLFGNTPVVFCGVNNFRPEDIRDANHFTGVQEDFDFKSTIEVALKLSDGITNVLIISDQTTSGKANLERLKGIIPSFGNKVSFEIVDNCTMEELQKKVAGSAKDTVAVWLHFTADKNGQFFSFEESSELISAKSNVPLFSSWDFHLDHGVVGGMVTSGVQQGYEAGNLALQVLAGTPPSAIPVVSESPNAYMFDYKQMKRFDIPITRLPKGAILINTPEKRSVKELVIYCFLFISFLLLSVGACFLLFSKMKRKKDSQHEIDMTSGCSDIDDNVEVALLVEDFSDIVDDLKRIEVEEKGRYVEYFTENPGVSVNLAQKIRIKKANKSALELYGAGTESELLGQISKIKFLTKKIECINFLIAILEKRTTHTIETINSTLSGERVDVLVKMRFPSSWDQFENVLVAIVRK